ncbi:MAG: hypothetical protein H0V98_10440 [Chloroflexia bacterium]|jgi:hypothetical protein|nr:hypothetical protein [Chloroflexia bacterium]MDQ3525663.1 DUF4242 domain-containing protein [Chloroflexota bacterium]
MTQYMVVHSPTDDSEVHTDPPTRLKEMAKELGKEDSVPRWINAYATDLTDDRIFSMWEAPNAASVREAMERYGFLNHLDPKIFAIREWGPSDVLVTSDEED